MPQEPTITWQLPLNQANIILNVLGKQPFETVADLIMDLRQQAGTQLQRLQQQQPPLPPITSPVQGDGVRADRAAA